MGVNTKDVKKLKSSKFLTKKPFSVPAKPKNVEHRITVNIKSTGCTIWTVVRLMPMMLKRMVNAIARVILPRQKPIIIDDGAMGDTKSSSIDRLNRCE